MAGGVAAALETARREGVTGAITISTTTSDCLEALQIADQFENVWCSAGVHPLHAHEGPHIWANLKMVAQHKKCAAWGELGLDNHYSEPARAVQNAVLEEQLAFIEGCAGEGLVKPVVIHCREAFDDLIPVLRRSRLDAARFVFHCFTGNPTDVRKVLDLGAWVSFTGVVTYKNASEVREAAKLVPPDRIMVETDAPYLSPDPHRGVRPCQPWMTMVTARKLAEVRGQDFDSFHAQLNENACRFFGLPPQASPKK
jgi:TatD DNase family protein